MRGGARPRRDTCLHRTAPQRTTTRRIACQPLLLGIMLRIRAFLYLGAAFTLMAMISMVWHATRIFEQTWPWWAFGFSLGIALLVLFGLFEKKKEEVQLLIARMRSWEQ